MIPLLKKYRRLLALLCAACLAHSSALAQTLAARKVGPTGLSIPLTEIFTSALYAGQAVRVYSSEGPFNMDLLPSNAPATVANFLAYTDSGAYRSLIVHRSKPGFVVQTGGWTLPTLDAVPTFAAVTNEFRLSNIRGTVAMAKVDGNPNSATSQWFVNLVDNSTNLDTQNGGFTVFARVLGTGMSNVDRIAALPVYDVRNILGAAFDSVPLQNYNTNSTNPAIYLTNIVTISNVTRLPGAISSDESAFTARVADGKLKVAFRAYSSNPTTTISAHALDSAKNPVTVGIPVTAPNQEYLGLLKGTNGISRAFVSIALTPAGKFTGKVLNPRGTFSISSTTLWPFAYTNTGSGVLFGALGEYITLWYDHAAASVQALPYTNTNFHSTLVGALQPAAWSGTKTDPCPLAGRIVNAVLTLTNTNAGTPVLGFLQCTIDSLGSAKISGRLADGLTFTASSRLVRAADDGSHLIPVAFFSGGTNGPSLTGDLRLWPAAPAGHVALNGKLDFAQGTNKSKFDVLGQFFRVNSGTNILTGSNSAAHCLLKVCPAGTALPTAVEQHVLWSVANVPTLTNSTNGLSFAFSASTGIFSGTLSVPSANSSKPTKRSFRGIIFSTNPPSFAPALRGVGFLEGSNPLAPVSLLLH